jgi:hypothetical protein
MKNEQEQVASIVKDLTENRWMNQKGTTYSGIDPENIREHSVLLIACVREVIKRPRYFQLTKTPDRLSYLIQWTVPSNLASGVSARHPYSQRSQGGA